MNKLEILTDPNPILRELASEVTSFDGELQNLIDDMIFTMRNSDGIGLAAPQIGQLKKIIVVEFDTDDTAEEKFPLTVIINPKIQTISNEKLLMMEGCLSFPGKEMFIRRPKKIKISGLDRWGNPINIDCDNLFSRVIQHEADHLNGILMIDYIKPIKTLFIGNGSLGVPAVARMSSDPQFDFFTAIISSRRENEQNSKINQNEIEKICQMLKLSIMQTTDINSSDTLLKINKLKPELIVVADFNQILKEKVIKIPKFGVLNIHPSLLPKYRGPSPVVSAMLAGEKKTGISIIKINTGIDTGDILSQIEVGIKNNDTALSLKETLATIGAALLTETVPYFIAGEIIPVVQNEKYATNTRRFQKSDGRILGNEDAKQINRMIRAFYPWPGVYEEINNKKIFILSAHFDKNKKFHIDKVKPEGKNEMSYQDFLNGYKVKLLKNVDK